jgi:hypothetical protein
MLDSREADTYRYESGQWRLNDGRLALGSEKRPSQRGVFHRSVDSESRQTLTGFYVNTNKTADINQDESAMGYVIPWQNEEVLYWLEKLRNWQAKYNPIDRPVPWTVLQTKHFGAMVPHQAILATRGETCFLFRDASASDAADRAKPLIKTAFIQWWYKLLAELERRVAARDEALGDMPLRFVDPNSKGTQFPLHSLRVGLITAYALDGGVPSPVLSKLIAGHARLIMTLYYTKGGKTHVSEVMQQAEKRLLESEQESYRRFLSQATYDQISECSERYVRLEQQVQALREEESVCQDEDRPFVRAAELERLHRFYEDEAEKTNKLAHDLHATLSLIERSKQLLSAQQSEGVELVAAGDLTDVGYALEEVHSKLHQLEVICENVVVYPEIDAGKAVLERSQLLDAMLELNGRSPVFFKLTSEQQLLVGNHLMQLIQQRVGSLANAVEVAEGKMLLRQLGLLDEALEVIQQESGLLPVPMKRLLPSAEESAEE